jgi:hypothetical protein
MSTRRQSTKHCITKYVVFGANVGGGGTYAIMATVRGSYGESIHRVFGNSYKDIEKCIARALKYYMEDGSKSNIELLHLQSQRRITMQELLSLQSSINRTH